MNLLAKKSKRYLSAVKNAVILKRPRVNYLPLSISIEASAECNLACEYCYQKYWGKKFERKKGMMELSLFKNFIEQIHSRPYPVDISFDLGGEPFLNPNLMDMVDLACYYGKLTNITTNGTLLTDKLIDRMLRSQLHKISISVDIVNGVNIRGGWPISDIAAKVNNLICRKKRLGKKTPRVIIRCINLRGAFRENILSLFEIKPDAVIFTPLTNWAGLIDSGFQDQRCHICLLPWLEMAMLYNGDFALCCNDPRGRLIVGNFPAEDITGIWQGERLSELRRRIVKRSPPFLSGQHCGECTRLRKKISLMEYASYFWEEIKSSL